MLEASTARELKDSSCLTEKASACLPNQLEGGTGCSGLERVFPVSVHAPVEGVIVESADNHPARRTADDR
jgi:hypothetical protein